MSNYQLKFYLKSNMDRFIESVSVKLLNYICNLKSNMDRFIGRTVLPNFCVKCHLKSNMDRFIEICVFRAHTCSNI